MEKKYCHLLFWIYCGISNFSYLLFLFLLMKHNITWMFFHVHDDKYFSVILWSDSSWVWDRTWLHISLLLVALLPMNMLHQNMIKHLQIWFRLTFPRQLILALMISEIYQFMNKISSKFFIFNLSPFSDWNVLA